jgi:hypothetical protein
MLSIQRHTHREDQPHKFTSFLTTYRSVPSGIPDELFGGDFYDATLGILVRAAASTMVWFIPDHWYGTTLPDMDPEDRETLVYQAGMSIVTSKRLAAAFVNLQEEITAEAIKELLEALRSDDDE